MDSLSSTSFNIRTISATDNSGMATVIRQVMTEFGAVGKGYSINDPEVDCLYETFQTRTGLFLLLNSKIR